MVIETPSVELSAGIAAAGDFNDDGTEDIAIAVRQDQTGCGTEEIYLVWGRKDITSRSNRAG